MAGELAAGVPRPRTRSLRSLAGEAALSCSLLSSWQPRLPGLRLGESKVIQKKKLKRNEKVIFEVDEFQLLMKTVCPFS